MPIIMQNTRHRLTHSSGPSRTTVGWLVGGAVVLTACALFGARLTAQNTHRATFNAIAVRFCGADDAATIMAHMDDEYNSTGRANARASFWENAVSHLKTDGSPQALLREKLREAKSSRATYEKQSASPEPGTQGAGTDTSASGFDKSYPSATRLKTATLSTVSRMSLKQARRRIKFVRHFTGGWADGSFPAIISNGKRVDLVYLDSMPANRPSLIRLFDRSDLIARLPGYTRSRPALSGNVVDLISDQWNGP